MVGETFQSIATKDAIISRKLVIGVGASPASTSDLHVYSANASVSIKAESDAISAAFILDRGATGASSRIVLLTSGSEYWNVGMTADSTNNLYIGTGNMTTKYLILSVTSGYLGLGIPTEPASMIETAETKTITGATTDGYSSAITIDPAYNAAAAQTLDRHNYLNLENVDGGANVTITDAFILRCDAALGTHKATTNTDKTANAKSGTLKVNINGTMYHIQLYANA